MSSEPVQQADAGRTTPGPWIAYHGPRDTLVSINTLDGRCIGGVWTETWRENERGINENVLANARLIAAAPEMYEALKLLVDNPRFELASPKVAGRVSSERRDAAIEAWEGFVAMARAALAKAKGR